VIGTWWIFFAISVKSDVFSAKSPNTQLIDTQAGKRGEHEKEE
jgi:hypothetical protein